MLLETCSWGDAPVRDKRIRRLPADAALRRTHRCRRHLSAQLTRDPPRLDTEAGRMGILHRRVSGDIRVVAAKQGFRVRPGRVGCWAVLRFWLPLVIFLCGRTESKCPARSRYVSLLSLPAFSCLPVAASSLAGGRSIYPMLASRPRNRERPTKSAKRQPSCRSRLVAPRFRGARSEESEDCQYLCHPHLRSRCHPATPSCCARQARLGRRT